MTITKTPPKKQLSHDDFTKKRESLIEQLKAAISNRDITLQRALRRQLLSDDLVP